MKKIVTIAMSMFASMAFAVGGAPGSTGSNGGAGPTPSQSSAVPNDGSVVPSGKKDAIARASTGVCVSRYIHTFGKPVPCPKKDEK